MPQRKEPIRVPAASPPLDKRKSAVIIFMHGLADEAESFEDIPAQFSAAGKLPYMQWVIPTALENRDAMTTAWYVPTTLHAVPSQRPELDDPEDEDGMIESREYIVSLIDGLVDQGVPSDRIVLAGFSQGCVMTLLTGLTSKYAGKLAGLGCIAGYMPVPDRILTLRHEQGLPAQVEATPILIQRGTKDILVPRRYHSLMLEKIDSFAIEQRFVDVHEYSGVGHTMNGPILRDFCSWLEKVLPPVE